MRKLSIINTQQPLQSPSELRAAFVQTNAANEMLLCSPRLWQQANGRFERDANTSLHPMLLRRIHLRFATLSFSTLSKEQRFGAVTALALHVLLVLAAWLALHSNDQDSVEPPEPMMVEIVPLLAQPNVENKPNAEPNPELPKPKLVTPPPTPQVTKPRAEKVANYTENAPVESADKPLPKEVTEDASEKSRTPTNSAKATTEANHDIKSDVSDKQATEPKDSAIPQPKPSQQKSAAEETVPAPQYGVAYLNNPKPVYPNLSRRAKEQGESVLLVVVDATGAPEKVEVLTSSGYERLDEAAVTAVKQWRFVPAKKAGQPVKAAVHVPIRFSLDS